MIKTFSLQTDCHNQMKDITRGFCGIYFCEYDGPRKRKVHVKVMQG